MRKHKETTLSVNALLQWVYQLSSLSTLSEINVPDISSFSSHGTLSICFYASPLNPSAKSFAVASVADEFSTDLLSDSITPFVSFYALDLSLCS